MIEEVEKLKEKVLESLRGSNVAVIKASLHDIYMNIDFLCTYNPITEISIVSQNPVEEIEAPDYQISFGNIPSLADSNEKEEEVKERKKHKKSISGVNWTTKILKEAEKFPKGFTAMEMAEYLQKTEIESLDYLTSMTKKLCSHMERGGKLKITKKGTQGGARLSSIYILPKFLNNENNSDSKTN